MKKNSKKFKKIAPALLVGQTGINKITLKNSGSVDLKYNLYLVKEESNFEPNVLSVDIDGANNSYTGVDNSERQLLTTGELKAGEYKTYDKFILFADENQKVANMINDGVGNTAKFHLEVDAVQVNGEFDNTPSTPPQETIALNTADKITIEGKEYTVIENVQGTQYKVLATDLANNGQEMKFGDNNNYATSTIADYLDGDYYNSLDTSIKNAIVEISIQQKVGSNRKNNNPTWTGETKDAGKHKVFLPSWDEVTKIYGTTPEGLKAYALNSWTWLRDTYGSHVLFVLSGGYLYDFPPDVLVSVRPAFVIDLSKVEFTKK